MTVKNDQNEQPAATKAHGPEDSKLELRKQLLEMIKRNESLRQAKPR